MFPGDLFVDTLYIRTRLNTISRLLSIIVVHTTGCGDSATCTDFVRGCLATSQIFFDKAQSIARVSAIGCTGAGYRSSNRTERPRTGACVDPFSPTAISWSSRARPFASFTKGVLFTLYRRVEITGADTALCCSRARHARWGRHCCSLRGGGETCAAR